MASEGGYYSPLATPNRSSLRRQGGRAAPGTPNSVRFFGITHDDAEEDHTDGLGQTRGRNSISVKQAIFKKYFNEFTAYPLLVSGGATQRSTRGSSRASSVASRSVHSATDRSRRDRVRSAQAWTPLSSTHVQSEFEPPWPRWAVHRQADDFDGKVCCR
jgi:hypothetical protein